MKLALALLVPLLSLVVLPLAAQPAGSPLPDITTIEVAAGKTATVTGQVAPGGRNLYYVRASSLQTMMVTAVSPGNNATFQVYGPNTGIARGTDGAPVITGTAEPNAGAADNATAWMGMVPQTGQYLIVVGSSRGNASYSLTITLQQ